MVYPKQTWKLFLTKASGVLNEALTILTNRSVKLRSPPVLEVVGELRINTLSEEQLQTVPVIHHLFHPKLRTLMSSVSVEFLSCLSSKNFTCETYHHVVNEFGYQFPHMDDMQQRMVLKHFILPFLTRNHTSDPACVDSTNGSEAWLYKNFKSYSAFVPLRELLMLNPNFQPLETLNLLSPRQTAELVVSPHPALSDKEAIITAVFDHFMESPNDMKQREFLREFAMLSQQRPLNCSSIQTIIKRLRHSLSSMPGRQEPVIWASINVFMQAGPRHCMTMPVDERCPFTPWNADLLTCKVSGGMVYPKQTWKLFLTKASGVLNEALTILTNRSVKLRSPPVLEVVGELRINTLSEEQLQTVPVIHHLFHPKLRTLMSSVSVEFLSCLSSKNFTCETYHHVVNEFGYQFPHMDEMQQRMVLKHFILRFLTRNHTSDPACVDSTNGSEAWLYKNFKSYSAFVPLRELLMLNPNFQPLETLNLLSSRQTAELVVSPHPALSDKETIINAVFDHFMESPNDTKQREFLKEFAMLSQQANLSCDLYKTILRRIDQAALSESSEFESQRMPIRGKIAQIALLHCSINDIIPGCPTTPVNESRICAEANSGAYTNTMMLCNNSLRHYACLSTPTNLTSEQVAMILSCNLMGNKTYSKETWKLLFTKVSGVLHEALLLFANMTPSLREPSASMVLDVISESLDAGITDSSEDVSLITKIFQKKLKPFLPFISESLLSCLSAKNFSCQAFEVIVWTLNDKYEEMDRRQRALVYMDFIQIFLSRTETKDPGCVRSSNGSVPWLQKNFGKFSSFLTPEDIQRLNRNFSVEEALRHLTVKQLANFFAAPGQLETAEDVSKLMSHVADDQLGTFFDRFSTVIEGRPFPMEARSAMLQQVLDRANLSDAAVSDEEAQVWLQQRLPPLLLNLQREHVGPLFNIVKRRDCNISQELVKHLSGIRQTLDDDTESEVIKNIVDSLRDPQPLRCYTNQSFYQFLKKSFLKFPSPQLSTVLSLMPPDRQAELINSIPPNELGELLRKPMFIDNSTDLCTLLLHHRQTPELLETEEFSEHVRSQILPCVWPLALRSDNEEEVKRWFVSRLNGYLQFLNEDLISSQDTLNASCLAFRNLIFLLGTDYNFSRTDIEEDEVYDIIKTYLSTDGSPKCYDRNDPTLNSTAWFFNYFCNFIRFADSDDFRTFGSEEALQVFSVNRQNIELLSQPGIPDDVVSWYTESIFQENPQFLPTKLPPRLQCYASGEALSSLDESQTLAVIRNINQSCTAVEPHIPAVLAGNIKTLSPGLITALGNQVTGLSPGQISGAPPSVIIGSLKNLGKVSGWNQAQSNSIIAAILGQNFQVDNQENLESLGSLIQGVPFSAISKISPTVAQQTASNPVFVNKLLSAPVIVREKFVQKIIEVDSTPQILLNNVPDDLASEIPGNLLIFSENMDPAVVQKINKKKWKPEQAALLFDIVAEGTSDADDLSTEMLQGFSCTRIRRFKKTKVRNLIRACRRRRNQRKVVLREPQLTCMSNIIKSERPQNFTELPSDMLLYLDYSTVQQATCKAYFIQTGEADFDVLSDALSGKKAELLSNAKSCLGVTGTNLNKETVEVLGNMCCTLDESHISDSDPLILEKLKNCKEFSDKQLDAMEKVLLRGTPIYGNPSKWNFKTLQKLEPLPVFLGSSFWCRLGKRVKRRYLRKLRKQKGSRRERKKLKRLFKQLRCSKNIQGADHCTVGNITQVTINDDSFPFGYDAIQFGHCLSVQVVKDNFAALAQKVDEDELQTIVLSKSKQAFPAGLSDMQLQLLGSVSRMASLDDISKWSIITIDNLAALMNSEDGAWEPEKSKAIILKYLETPANTLGTAELNAIGGPNLCPLPNSVLRNITPESLKNANSLTISACPVEFKDEMFLIAEQAFNESDPISLMTYQLIQSYLGGAPKDYILRLSRANVSMDLETFINLNSSVLLDLNVTAVSQLLGGNVQDLKTFEHVTVIQHWIQRQPQSDLDSLGIERTPPVNTTSTPTSDCMMMPFDERCPSTPCNESGICSGVHNSKLQDYLDSGMTGMLCNITLTEYACSSLASLTGEKLADLLTCKVSGGMVYPKQTWKLFLTKASGVLNEALTILTNRSVKLRSLPVLEVVGELRINTLSVEQLQTVPVIHHLFHPKLRTLMSSVSVEFLSCLSSKNFTCETYHHVVNEFGYQFPHMDEMQQRMVLKHFILPFLTRNHTSDPACVDSTNGSEAWLYKNFKSYSAFVPLRELLMLNPNFQPLETLNLLSPRQTAELVVSPHPALSDKEAIITAVFDHFMESPNDMKQREFLREFAMLSQQRPLNCSSIQTIIKRLRHSLSSMPGRQEPVIWASINVFMQAGPRHCMTMPVDERCPFTPWNESSICSGVHNSSLQDDLNSGMTGMLCNITLTEYACSSLASLTGEKLADLLTCKVSGGMVYPKQTWKLFLTKASGVLNEALTILTNRSVKLRSPPVLEVVGELRINTLSVEQLQTVPVIHHLFHPKLRTLMSSVSVEFLSCLSSKNFTCETYHHVVNEFGYQFPHMDDMQQRMVLKHFILRFLTRNHTSDPACVDSTNGSEAWLYKNFKSYSAFVPLRELLMLNPNFQPLETLNLLSPRQTAELVVSPHPALSDKEAIITAVFDHFMESPNDMKQREFLREFAMLSQQRPLNCSSIQTIIKRLRHSLSSMPGRQESVIWASINVFMQAGPRLSIHTMERSSLQDDLDSGMTGMLCNITLTEYACSSLASLTGEKLADLLTCKVSGGMVYPKQTWKLFLTKASGVLNEALTILTNRSVKLRSPPVLEVVGELRINTLSVEQLQTVPVIHHLFHPKLRTLMSSVSVEFLSCLSSKNFTCETYHHVVNEFGYQFPHMDDMQQRMVLKHFILPFLTRNHTSDPACVDSTNGSEAWLYKNFKSYSAFVPLRELLMLNPNFQPLETLNLLSSRQTAELVVSPHPALSDKETIINVVFDHFMESPNDTKQREFLKEFAMLSQQANLSCDLYKTILRRIDQAALSESSEFESQRMPIRGKIAQIALLHCSINDIIPGCPTTPVNESRICAEANSGAYTNTMMLCNNSLRHYACLSTPTNLTSEQVAMILSCNLMGNKTYSKETWKLLFTKVSGVLHEALLLFANMTPSLREPSASMVLDVISESLDAGITDSSEDVSLITKIFQKKLKPFLPFISESLLSCLSAKNFSCQAFEVIVWTLNDKYEEMDTRQRALVYIDFIQIFLSRTETKDPGCVRSSNGSVPWLQKNFGKFSSFLTPEDIQRLNRNFSVEEALRHLPVKQLANFFAAPGQLETAEDVSKLMSHVADDQLGTFFDRFSTVIEGRPFPMEARSAMLQQVLDRANLSDAAVSDEEAQVWLQQRLPPLLLNLQREHVGPLFNIVKRRDCNISQELVKHLSGIRQTLDDDTESEVIKNIVDSLRDPQPLRCYTNQSFYQFLKKSIVKFPSPQLSTVLSLMPPDRQAELINSIPPNELGELLRKPMFIDNSTDLCTLLLHHRQTPELLETEEFSEHVRSQILPCVWPLALRSDNEEEVKRWFVSRLNGYLQFLNEDLISSQDTLNASCLAFRNLIFLLGTDYNFSRTDIEEDEVYDTIKTYLSTDGSPKCYDRNDPTLNSTAWFFNYFCNFIRFADSDDFRTFGSEEALQAFSVNRQNIELLSQPGIPDDVVSWYTESIFQENPQFLPTKLPPRLQCYASGEALSSLDESQTLAVIRNINQSCTAVEPHIPAVLAGNIKTLSPGLITALGNQVTGLSPGQISGAPPSVIIGSLKNLGKVSGWNQAQSNSIIAAILGQNFQVDNQENLESLGSLIQGVPFSAISKISPTVAQQTASNPVFVNNLLSAPVIVREKFVQKIIEVDSTPQILLNNVPDDLASEIPRSLLIFSENMDPAVVQKINKKKWKPEQAALLFDIVAEGTSDADDLSTEMLQGFSCTRIRRFKKTKVRNLIRACRRRRNQRKVVLREPQLTCMSNIIKSERPQNFTELPSDMLLYLDYSTVQQATCKAYFIQTGEADFDVLSDALSGKKAELLSNAKSCLGVTGTNLNKETVEVLGNMCCTLDESHISDSDPLILEKLKNCKEFSDKQLDAMEKVLLRGTPIYGNPSKWNFKTLQKLEPLPVFLGSSFWCRLGKRVKRRYLRKLRKQKGSRRERKKLKRLFKQLRCSKNIQGADHCTVGNITQVTINDDSFPFGYDAIQFGHCLSVQVVKDNFAALAQKVDEDELQTIVLSKSKQAFPAGLSDMQLQLLGSVSRMASLDDISKWSIITIDNLAALMNSEDGAWEPEKSKAIILKYLETPANTLGTAELNAIGGPNLCPLPNSVLRNITPESLKNANSLTISACPVEFKDEMFLIAEQAFNESDPISLMTYQLIQSYLGGAPKDYILRLSRANVSMDLETFINLNSSVLLDLNVTAVSQLLGGNVQDLKTFEHVTVIQHWIQRQPQSDLDSLGIERTPPVNTTSTPTSDCMMMPFDERCPSTPCNESGICSGVHNSKLQDYLDSGMTGMLCNITLTEYACSSLASLTGEKLADLLTCKVSGGMVYPKQTWKLFLTKASGVLNEALTILTNRSVKLRSLPVLEVVGELRINTLSEEQLQTVPVIHHLFHPKLRTLMSSVSVEFLSCLSSKNFTCETYHHVVNEFGYQFPHMDEMQQRMVLKHFILPFLTRNHTSDPACVDSTNGSEAWLYKNFKSYSAFVPLRELLMLNPNFQPLETLNLLSPRQTAELVVSPHPALSDKEAIITAVFDHFMESPNDMKQREFLREFAMLSQQRPLNCSSIQTIIKRLRHSLSSMPGRQEPVIWASINVFMQAGPRHCMTMPVDERCPFTPWNESSICSGVHNSSLQDDLNSGMTGMLCNITLTEYACSSLASLTGEKLADLLTCKVSGGMVYPKQTWKLFLTKASGVLNEALTILTNRSVKLRSPPVLEVVGELRINTLSVEQLQTVPVIHHLFHPKLRTLMSSVSVEFLSCLSSKNFTCETYHHVVNEFGYQFPHMDDMQQRMVLKHFILPFLTRNHTSDPACVDSTNGSEAWLYKNFKSYSAFVPLRELLMLNPNFQPLETLNLLSPRQTAELVVSPHPALSDKEAIITAVFDHFMESPNDMKQREFLREFAMLSQQRPLNCSSIQTIIKRLRHSLSSMPGRQEPVIWASINVFMQAGPRHCMTMPVDERCPFTPWNADLLTCKVSGGMVYPKQTWKLFLTKASGVLNEALTILTNRSVKLRSPPVLEVVGELRINTLSVEQLQTVPVIHHLFHPKLRTLMSSVSVEFLSCLSSKNFTCETYHHVVNEFGYQFPHMDEMQQRMVLKHFILPFLTRNHTSDPACVDSTNGSEAWLYKNFKSYSAFVPLRELLMLNPNFQPLETLNLLSSRQTAELVVSPHPALSDKETIINAVFDHFMESPNDTKQREFLKEFAMLSQQANLSCDLYKTILRRIDQAALSESSEFESQRMPIRGKIAQIALLHCSINDIIPGCPTTPVNESRICAEANSGAYTNTMMLCNNSLRHYACLSTPTNLTSEQVAMILSCNLMGNKTYSKETWKLLFTKVSGVLHEALLLFANMTPSLREPSASMVLDVISESLDAGITDSSEDVSLITKIFQKKLKPFLPFISESLLSCLSAKNFSCQAFEVIVWTLNDKYEEMDRRQRALVYMDFIQIFLSRTETKDPGCVRSSNGSVPWLQKNFGKFSSFLTPEDIQRLNRNFSVEEALRHLTVKQLANFFAAPGQLETAEDVSKLMSHVADDQLGTFFDRFSTVIEGRPFPMEARSAMLQQVLDRANLSDAAVSDEEAQVWLQQRLPPLLLNLQREHVGPLFNIVKRRDCNISQELVKHLSGIRQTLDDDTESEVIKNIVDSLRDPQPLRCYTNQSFYQFLKKSFLKFPSPQLSTVLSLMPPDRQAELINSIPPNELGELLRKPMFIDNSTDLCTLLLHHRQTPELLETEEFSEHVRSQILPCVWPLALRSDNEEEVKRWFVSRLNGYLQFLNEDLISSQDTLNASCLAFRNLIFLLGTDYNFSRTDIEEDEVYDTIKTYLSTDGSPKCYDRNDPTLNSTAWFFNYFCNFIRFADSDDFRTFGSEEALQVFSVNRQNIELLSQPGIPDDVVSWYTESIFQENPQFLPTKLPPRLQCYASGEALSSLDESQTLAVIRNINQSCTAVEPHIPAVLAGNIKTLSPGLITALGNQVTGLSPGQISGAPPSVIIGSLKNLGKVSGWNQAQSNSIIAAILGQNFQVDNQENLESLGSLIQGVPFSAISKISPTVAQQTASNPVFVNNLLSAPVIVREKFVQKIIEVDSTPQILLNNVPDDLASEIPGNLLIFSENMDPAVVQKINKKKWKPEQAALLFDIVAEGTSDADDLSTEMLQGFSCTRIRRFKKTKVRNLIRACRRRRNQRKVVLREPQLTCMSNIIKSERPQNFTELPSDMLLYLDYSTVQQATCKAYFIQTGEADFDVLSDALSGKKAELLSNAKSCLGVTGTNLNKETVEVLGNMCCTLDESHISDSDPLILEKLKNCKEFSDKQLDAMEKVLLRGTPIYGNPSKWNFKTLQKLEPLPVFLGSSFWCRLGKRVKRRYLRKLRKQKGSRRERKKLKRLFKQLRCSKNIQGADHCTVGNITQVTINDDSFPFGYDAIQFGHCLSVQVVKDNFAALAQKVDEDELQTIVLSKSKQAFPAGLSDVQLQLVGPVSRMASLDDISKWSIITIDNLAALMNSEDGAWEPEKSKAIILKYLETPANTLGTAELNAIGGPNLCPLPNSVLRNITPESLKNANSLTISACPVEFKDEMFLIAEQAFNESDPISLMTYQLIQSYLGGAPKDYILRLSRANVSMDLETFINLNSSVLLDLNVTAVSQLLGGNVQDLKTFEHVTVIQHWIQRQPQSDLDSLGIERTPPVNTTSTPTSDCMMMPFDERCPSTPCNESGICSGVHNSKLQDYLDSGMTGMLCNITLTEYACSSLASLTGEKLADLLTCKVSGGMVYPKQTWKLFLTKASGVLNEALTILTNRSVKLRSLPVLEVVGELRINTLSVEQLQTVPVIHHLFHPKLRTLMSSVSVEFLSCLSSKNFTCETYHHVVNEFGYQFPHMDEMQQRMVLKHFILPFLTRNHTSDPACVDSTNGSEAWLYKNFKSYSAFVPLRELLMLNPNFQPLETLNLLSPRQTAELVVSPHPALSDKEAIITAVFDHFMESPNDMKQREFLREFAMLSQQRPLNCSSIQTIIKRLRHSLSSMPGRQEPVIWASINVFMQAGPRHCMTMPVDERCPFTPWNESSICSGVHNSSLQDDLNSGMTGMLCNITLTEYACSSLASLTGEKLADLLTCKVSGGMVYPKQTWKLFLTKASGVLNEALTILTNRSVKLRSPPVLEVVGELRINTLSVEQLQTVPVIHHLFHPKLRTLMSSVSVEFLSCLSSKNFTCETYHHVVNEFGYQFPHMDDMQQRMVLKHFILRFLTRNHTSDPACVDSTNGSEAWLYKNFKSYSAFVPLRELLMLNPNFQPLETLNLLSPRQTAELVVSPHPALSDKEAIITAVFDHFMESPNDMKQREFLREFAMLSQQRPLNCSSIQTIIKRLRHSLSSMPGRQEPVIWASINVFMQAGPRHCMTMPVDERCPFTPWNGKLHTVQQGCIRTH
ncbi:uncharacterized protein LOC133114198 [Conger conger]|uniref:uncharacterized protein LOC133114198 n=1 Tax=Conger conger TaxID=82655 RepID=UPI002A5A7CBC|nr:uncharacterized protein LOC133114198 [Conger conger]